MDISKFKDIVQKLNVFKDYSSLLAPAVLTVIAVLVLIFTPLMGSRLKKQVEKESISTGKKIKSLTKNTIAHSQWEKERDYQLAHERDAKEISLLARQSGQRQLLSYKIFPEPKDTSVLIFEQFGQRFRGAVDEHLARLNARDCPTEAELQRSLQGSSGKSRSGRGTSRSHRRAGSGEVDAMIQDELCRARAESVSVYTSPADLGGYEFWGKREQKQKGKQGPIFEYTGMDEAVNDCWYGQLAYWIIEDVIDTIAACNSGSSSVFTSPVKRLLAVSFTRASETGRSGERTVGQKPKYVLSVKDTLTEPCTARLCNDDTDVVHFNAVVLVSTKAILPFMQQLCSAKQHEFSGFFGEGQEQIFRHNQITILESNISPINQEDEAHRLYRYGEDAVVELNLICEYVFNKAGYDEVKPEPIKNVLNGLEDKDSGKKGSGRR